MTNDFEIPEFELPEIDIVVAENEDVDTNDNDNNDNINNDKPVGEVNELATAFYDQIKQRGYVSEDTEFKGTWEELDEYFDSLPQQVLNSTIQSLPDLSKDVIKFIATAGQNITKEEMKTFFQTYFEEVDQKETTIETLDDARDFLKSHYESLGAMKPKAILAALDSLEEDEELLDEAKRIFEEKTKASKTKELINNKESQNKEIQEKNKERVTLIQEELSSTGWKKEKIERVTNILSKEFNSRLNDIISNPKAIVQLADFLDLFDTKTKQFDLTSYKNQAASKELKGLKDRLTEASFSSGGTNTKHVSSNPLNKEELIPVDL